MLRRFQLGFSCAHQQFGLLVLTLPEQNCPHSPTSSRAAFTPPVLWTVAKSWGQTSSWAHIPFVPCPNTHGIQTSLLPCLHRAQQCLGPAGCHHPTSWDLWQCLGLFTNSPSFYHQGTQPPAHNPASRGRRCWSASSQCPRSLWLVRKGTAS